MNPSFKIILLNVQAGVGVTKGYWQYFTSSWKYFFKHSFDSVELKNYIQGAEIDIAVLLEISSTIRPPDNTELSSRLTGFKQSISADYKLWKLFRLGNLLATHYKILSSECYNLPATGEKRPLIEVLLEIEDKKLKIFVTHLSLLKSERAQQILHIKRRAKNTQEPFILAADLNTDNEVELFPLLELGLQRISLPCYPSWKPTRKLDSLFINNKLSLMKSWTSPLVISDHLPIVAELKFKNAI